jgi:tRNA nucleotidyltransferase/poly(A) polymerase
VKFTSIDKDVLRRDLTINALFYDIEKKEIVDLVGGIDDLRKKNVRTVGHPEDRFNEDALRKLRAVRFAIRLGGQLDAETYNALKKDPELREVSAERIRDEFFVKTLGIAKSIRKAVDLLNDLGFFPYIFPDLKVNTDEVIEGSPIGTVALMLRENDPNKLKNTLIDYRYEAPEASAVTFLIRLQGLTPDNAFLMKKMQDRSSLKDDPETVREFARRFVSEKLADAFADYKVTTSGTELEEQGFKGEAIGKEMNRVETEKFKALLH